ncbi:LPXTG-motif cell wall anchor domain protein [Streptococcus sp. oral taxon 056 str. F0418]|nr:LPXTG-motif cell wall anchor domain protein [Streptococcus sp. oral taxon 056 str. F0418]
MPKPQPAPTGVPHGVVSPSSALPGTGSIEAQYGTLGLGVAALAGVSLLAKKKKKTSEEVELED